MSVLCDYVIAAYSAYCRIFAYFSKVHMLQFCPINWHLKLVLVIVTLVMTAQTMSFCYNLARKAFSTEKGQQLVTSQNDLYCFIDLSFTFSLKKSFFYNYTYITIGFYKYRHHYQCRQSKYGVYSEVNVPTLPICSDSWPVMALNVNVSVTTQQLIVSKYTHSYYSEIWNVTTVTDV